MYLTDSYAPYFAFNATKGNHPICAVIEIDTDLLDQTKFSYDEDCWEQLGRQTGDDIKGDMSARTIAWRRRQTDQTEDYQQAFQAKDGTTGWRLSLRALGTCCYFDTIPSSSITRIVSWPHEGVNLCLAFVWDPMISLINQRICGDRYRILTRKLFDGDFWQGPPPTSEDQRAVSLDPERAILPPIEEYCMIDMRQRKAA